MVKQEPETYSWDDFVKDGRTDWSGVRNYQARNNLRQMNVGDRVLFYHSGKEKAVIGLAEVVKGAYPDPTADDSQWVAVDLKPGNSWERRFRWPQFVTISALANYLLSGNLSSQ